MIRMMLTVFGPDIVFGRCRGLEHRGLARGRSHRGRFAPGPRPDESQADARLPDRRRGRIHGRRCLARQPLPGWSVRSTTSSATLHDLLLFLAAGIIVHRSPKPASTAFDGACSRKPATMSAFTLGALSMIGIAPDLRLLQQIVPHQRRHRGRPLGFRGRAADLQPGQCDPVLPDHRTTPISGDHSSRIDHRG